MLVTAKPSYDSDASAYFTTAGVTSTAGRQQVSRFVTGIKDLGLWSNMVCWPLRSSQNAGTGTIAYSLGGLGTFNGTLTNGPTWGANGIIFDGTNDYINTGFNPVSAGLNRFSCFLGVVCLSNPTNPDYAQLIGNEAAANWQSGSGIARGATGGIVYYFLANSSGSNSSSGETLVGMVGSQTQNSTQVQFVRNGSQVAVGSPLRGNFANNNFFIGAGNSNGTPNYYSDTTLSFSFVFSTSLSSGNLSSFYLLYKSTLGQGLGLP